MPKPAKISAQQLIGTTTPAKKNSFIDKDCILYALGVGFGRDPLRQQDFKYTYENDGDFGAFPTYAVVLNDFDVISPLMESPSMPNFSPFVILHAEQKLVMVKEKLEPGTEYTHSMQIVDVADKGKNALILFRIDSFTRGENNKQELAFQNYMTMFFRGLGGFGFKGKGLFPTVPAPPKRHPDQVLSASTFPGQAILYRLTGDINPLHIDPSIASSQKFDRPIIHGLASYGIVARALIQEIAGNEPSRLQSYHARFIGHVFPGEHLSIAVWKQPNQLVFEATVQERNTKALVGAMELRAEAKL